MASEDLQIKFLRFFSKLLSLWVTVVCTSLPFSSTEESLATFASTIALFLSHLLALVHLLLLLVVVPQVQQLHPVMMRGVIQRGWSPCDKVI